MVETKYIVSGGVLSVFIIAMATLILSTDSTLCSEGWQQTDQAKINYCVSRDIYRACSYLSSSNKTCYHIGNITDIQYRDISADDVDVEQGKEVSLYGYKYSNTSNLIMSSIQRNSCNWYPDSHPKKDLKTCEIIIGVINKNPIKSLNLTKQTLSFLNQNRVTNYTITTEYSNYKDEFKLDNNESNKINITRKKWANFNKIKAQETLNSDFSIKAVFDMPKYETEQFNITLDIKHQGNIIQLSLDPDVGACGTLSSANSLYTLNSSINTTGTCFTIGANNITLDGGGYTITGDGSATGRGIHTASYDALTIKNFGGINNFTTSIYLTGTINSTINNNTIIGANVTSGYGIYANTASSNTISNNNITTSGTSGYGIPMDSSSNNNNISANTITTSGNDGIGIYLISSSNNALSANTIKTTRATTAYGVYLSSGINNTFTDDNITATGVNDIRIASGSGTLTNVTFNKTDIAFDSGTATGNITVKWYLTTTVQNTSGSNLQNANVSVYNNSVLIKASDLTNSNGITLQTLTDYWRNASNTYYETPHTVNTTLTNYITNSTTINITATSSTALTVQLTALYTFFFKVLDNNGLEIDSANVTVTNSTYTFASCITNTTGQCTVNDLTQSIAYNIVSTKTNYDNGINNTQTPTANGTTIGLSMVIQQAKFTFYHQQLNCSNTNQSFGLNGFCFGIDYSNGTRTETDCTNSSGIITSSMLSTNIEWNIVPLNYSGVQYDSLTPPFTLYTFRQPIFVNNTLGTTLTAADVEVYRVTSTQVVVDVTGSINSSGLFTTAMRNNSIAYNFHADNLQGGQGENLYLTMPQCLVPVTIEERSANNIQNCTNTISQVLNELRVNATAIRSDIASTNTTAGSTNNSAISNCVWGISGTGCTAITRFIHGVSG